MCRYQHLVLTAKLIKLNVKSTVTGGKDFNITCSSIGGSPPPEILWFKNGAKEKL